MQVASRLPFAGRAALLVGAFLATLPAPVVASMLDSVDEQDVSYVVNYFTDAEGIRVLTHHAGYEMALASATLVAIDWARDTVIIPAIDATPGTPEAVDAVTSASRPITGSADAYEDFSKTRNVLQGSVARDGLQTAYYVSSESDYFAQMLSAGYDRDFLGDNLNLAGAVSYGWDRIDPLADDSATGGADDQRRRHASVVATQILTPTTVFRFGAEADHTDGLQHDPYRSVFVAGTYVPERHPDQRDRYDLFLNVNQYLTGRSSVHVDYKLYGDDWGVTSSAVGAKLHQYVSRNTIVRYRYRFYTQTGADFWRDEYVEPGGVGGFQTADYRLGRFHAHLFGTKVTWNLGRGPLGLSVLDGVRATVKYERYFNSNNFSANIFESGCTLSF